MGKYIASENQKSIINVQGKKELIIIPATVDEAKRKQELEELQEKLEVIRKKYYSDSATVHRVMSRSFWAILQETINEFFKKRNVERQPEGKS